jgi:hypothetical protein
MTALTDLKTIGFDVLTREICGYEVVTPGRLVIETLCR